MPFSRGPPRVAFILGEWQVFPHLLSGELHAEPRYNSRLLEDSLRRNRKKNFVILPSPARRRRSPFSVAFPNGARSISGAIPGNHGREQAVAVGEQCQCRGGV